MREYELVHEIQNLCRNNQMRDVFFQEVECDDPVHYLQQQFQGRLSQVTVTEGAAGAVTVHASCDGLNHKFLFTPIG